MPPILATSLAALIFLSPNAALSAKSLTKAWECEALMDKPESALHCPQSGRILVSNISGDYFALDGTGFISALDLDGKVVQRSFASGGLDNPQGLAAHNGILYVADLTRVVAFDLESGQQLKVIEIEGSAFINDLSADANGDLYASECKLNRVYRIRDGAAELWLEATELNAVNGVLCLEQKILLANFGDGTVYSVDKYSKELTLVCDGVANADGIASDGANGFFISGAWQGEVFHFDLQGNKERVLDLGPEKKIAADICYLPSERLLIIPTLHQTVLAYRWE